MATNSRDYMRLYQARRRQSLRGWGTFNLDLALAAHRRLIALGVGKDEARAARDWRATLALALDDRKQGAKYWENNGRYIVRDWNGETEPGDYCRDFTKQQILDY